MLPLSEVQTALYGALVPALSPVPVLDYAGPDQEYPFCTIGEFTAEEDDTLLDEGIGMDVLVHLWSRSPGMQQLQLMMSAVKDALHRATLSLPDGMQYVSTVCEFAQTLRDADGVTRHGVMRFRVMVFLAAAALR
jgi:hypothetical protein